MGSVLVNVDIYICEIKNYAMYLSLFYLFSLRDKHYKAFLVAELTHASGNFFSNQPKLLETFFIGLELCYLLFPITLLKFWVGVQKAKV